MTRNPDDLAALKTALADNAETLLVELFGEPNSRRGREWRWGSKGSVAYRFDRRTFWNFEMDAGGSLLDAIMLANGCSFPQAVTWARGWLGDDATPRPAAPRKKRATFDADAEQQRALSEASALWRAGRGINGTAVARYLQGRAIDGWPADSVRLIGARDVARIAWRWWRWPALMFPLSNDAGTVTAVQLVALTDQGEAVPHWEHGGKIKMVRGVARGSALRLQGDASGPLILAEGGETALSIWLATGYETRAVFGAIGRASLDGVPLSRAIVVGRDDDPRTTPRKTGRGVVPKLSPSLVALDRAVRKWTHSGRRVVVTQPWALSRGDKSDFNDVLKQHGPDAVRDRIDAALRPQATTQGAARKDALLALSTAVGRNVSDLLAWHGDDGEAPPFKVIRATLGLGKSQAALEAIVDAIGAEHRIVYSAPTHDLAAELAARAEAIASKRGRAVTVRVWHGRERANPNAPTETMCSDLEAAELAQRARLDVSKTVCDGCQHRAACAYLAQREAAADLWIVPHALLFAGLPAAMKGAAMLVIDEDFALAGITGTDGTPALVRFASLVAAVTAGNGKPEASADLNATLGPIRRRLLDTLADHPAPNDGEPLQRAALVAAGLTVEAADDARKAEGRRRRDVDAITAAPRADLMRELRAIMGTNVAAALAAALWRHIADLLADDGATASGRVDVVTLDAGERAFRLYGLEKMGDGWRDLPTLHLDATAEMDLIRRRVPHAELAANVEAAEPNVTVHQIVGKTFGKTALEHGKTADDARRFVMATAGEAGGNWLAVASKGAAGQWRETLPPYVGVAHWGGLRGLDKFNDVRGVICVGRWGVTPNDVGRMAAILTGRAVPRVEGWYPVEALTLTANDGSARTVDVDRHPDPTAEAVRRSLVEAELLQAIGRGRGVQRTAGNPLVVYVLGNVPLPVPLASISDWHPLDPDRAMLADTGAWLESSGDAADLTGESRKAIKSRRERARMAPCPYKNLLYGRGANLPEGLAAATYQRRGPGRGEQRMVYDPRRLPDPQAWLEASLGALVHFEGDGLAAISTGSAAGLAKVATSSDLAAAQNSAETAGPTLPGGFSTQYAREADRPAAFQIRKPPAATFFQFQENELAPPPPLAAFEIIASVEFSGAIKEAAPADPWADYAGGIMSDTVRDQVRDRWRASGLRQDQLAERIGISRPQFANALQGRFGLSPDAAARLRAVVASLPVVQAALL